MANNDAAWKPSEMSFKYFYRHCHLCSTSIFGRNSSDFTAWCYGNGNLNFHYWGDLYRTSDWPQVMNKHIKKKNFSHSSNATSLQIKYQAEVLVQLYRELLGKEEYWPILLSTTCIPAFLQLLILPWFPESPRYLLIDKGDEEGCKKGKTAAPFLPFQIAGNCVLPGKMT